MQGLRKRKILKLAVGEKNSVFFPAGGKPSNQYRQRVVRRATKGTQDLRGASKVEMTAPLGLVRQK